MLSLHACQGSQRPRCQRNLVATPPPPPERSRHTPQPVSASPKIGRRSVCQMRRSFPITHRGLWLLDRAACVLGGRWCAASVRAPLAPYEGSDPPHDLSSSVKRKTGPSLCECGAESAPSARSAFEITIRAVVAPVLDVRGKFPAHQKSMARGGLG